MPVRVESCFAMDRRRAGVIRFETIDACGTLPEDFAVSEQSLSAECSCLEGTDVSAIA